MANLNVPKNQNLVVERFDYRIVFGKTGRSRFISHLDLMRTMQRVFKRAKIPVWYTQGFNPHLYLMFPLALPLGTSSNVEIMDIALIENLPADELMNRLNAVMPEGLRINSVGTPVYKHTEISSAEYEILFSCDKSPDAVAEAFKAFVAQQEIVIMKRSKKKGEVAVDIKPHIDVRAVAARDDMTFLSLCLPAGSDFNLNTQVVIDAFESYAEIKINQIYTTRTKISMKDGNNFT